MIIKISGQKMEMNSSLKQGTFKDSDENFPCSLTIHYSQSQFRQTSQNVLTEKER